MTGEKVRKLRDELFQGTGAVMAKNLETSANKISVVISGKQKLSLEAVGILLTKYRIDPEWLFYGEDHEPIRYTSKNTHIGLADKKYEELQGKIIALMEERAEFMKEKIESLKKSESSDAVQQ